MGILRWGLDAARSAYADQPKEVLLAEDLSNDILAVPASSKGRRQGTNRVITDGSVFNVGINQAALLIENGKVHDFVIADSEKTTGQYIYDSSAEPSLLTGGTKEWGDVWKMVKDRFSFGGTSPNTMDLVYINLKEITGNPVGVGKVPFIDTYLSTRLLMGVHGYYTFRIANPALFYENLIMDPDRKYRKEEITEQLRVEMMPKIQNALAVVAPLCANGYQDIYLHDEDIAKALNEALKDEWLDRRGIELIKVALTPELSPADEKRVMELENARTFSNTDMALGSMVNAQNQAMMSAGKNPGGAMSGFMGVNMAGAQGGISANELLKEKMSSQAAKAPTSSGDSWTCQKCGQANSGGKFCSNCGTPRPASRFCSQCGEPIAPGTKFCSNCGAKVDQ